MQDFFNRLLESGYIYKKVELQAYCSSCDQFLPDRFVVGICPNCSSVARGDQCDICSDLLEPSILNEPKCTLCGNEPEFRPSEHFYLSLSSFQNWAVWVLDLLSRYQSDTLRYFFIGNGPEKRDGDFSFRELINSHNGELLGAYGNFVNRSLVFIQKSFEEKVPQGKLDILIKNELIELYENTGRLIEDGCFKEALEKIFLFIRSANKYFDEKQPWLTVKNDISNCKDTIYTCVQIIANLSVLLEPFLPFSSAEIHNILKIKDIKWEFFEANSNTELENIKVLFERIDKRRIEEEAFRLKSL